MPVIEPTPGMWYTIKETAELCHRAPTTIRDLVYDLKVPKKLIRFRPRRAMVYLPAESVRYLQSITLKL